MNAHVFPIAVFILCTIGSSASFAEEWSTLPQQAASPEANPTTAAKVELGKKLFFDPRLSLTGTVSCNSCHNIMEGGDDGRPTSMGVHGRIGPRNAPTVWNSVFQASQFWDGRSPSLEDQAKGPIVAAPEMGMPSHETAILRIVSIPGYRAEFGRVFGVDKPVTLENAVRAIAAFERTLITPNSAYDQFVGGDASALNDKQIRGMKLFASVGCTECHSGPAFNGWEIGSTKAEFEKFPRFDSTLVKKYRLDEDRGRFEATKNDSDKHRFKVPTLRNITITAPYYHSGAVSSLSVAVRVMAKTQLDVELPGDDIDNIVAFLGALDGEFPEITLPRLPSRAGESVIEKPQSAKSFEMQRSTPHHGPPFGRGRGRRSDARFDTDHAVFQFLLDNRRAITRKVTQRKDGIETVTESNDPKVAARIREHVAAMYDRVKTVKPIHMRDPLFRELFRHAKQIQLKKQDTESGIRVIETSDDPYVAELIRAHADVVSLFIKNGHSELRKNHAVPRRPARSTVDSANN